MLVGYMFAIFFFFFKQKTAYEMRISDWSSDVCSSDLVSTALGDWLDPAQAGSIDYWTQHLRVPVRFSGALARVLDAPSRVLLEVGPRHTLTKIGRASCRERVCQYV